MKFKTVSKREIQKMIYFSLIIVLLFWDKNYLINNNIYIIIQHFLCDLFTPLKLYTTAIHEGWHALTTLLTGGEIREINLDLNGSGHVISTGGNNFIIIPAGYIGSALTGALLIISVRIQIITKLLLLIISTSILYLNFIYINNYFSLAFISSIIMSIIIIYLIFKTDSASYLAIFLGTILAIDSFGDIKKIVFQIPYQTDAGILAKYLKMEFLSIPIAIAFSIICMYIWWLSIKYIMKK